MKRQITVVHTPQGLFPYEAHFPGLGWYCIGNTAQEARDKLREEMQKATLREAARKKENPWLKKEEI